MTKLEHGHDFVNIIFGMFLGVNGKDARQESGCAVCSLQSAVCSSFAFSINEWGSNFLYPWMDLERCCCSTAVPVSPQKSTCLFS